MESTDDTNASTNTVLLRTSRYEVWSDRSLVEMVEALKADNERLSEENSQLKADNRMLLKQIRQGWTQ